MMKRFKCPSNNRVYLPTVPKLTFSNHQGTGPHLLHLAVGCNMQEERVSGSFQVEKK